MTPVTELQAVSHRFGEIEALADLDLSVAEGEVLGLMGHNGAGKSTTVKLILGLLQPTRGRVRLFGNDPAGPAGADLRARVGYLPENVQFYDQLTGREVLRYLARLKRAEGAEANRLLERVGLADAADRRVRTYSKGMRQRLGLAQALIGRPRLLLMDEPTVGLDPVAIRAFYETVSGLRDDGVSVVLCTHVLPGLERHLDRAAILGGGRLMAAGTLDELRRQAALPALIRVRAPNPERLLDRLTREGYPGKSINAEVVEVAAPETGRVSALRSVLDGEAVWDVEWERPDLEHIYLHFDRQLEEGR